MKVQKITIATLLILLWVNSSRAQSKTAKTVQTANNSMTKTANDVNATGSAVNSTADATVNSAKSIVNAKNAIGSLFKSKKSSNQIVIAIAGIEFEDENLTVLKDGISKAKGVKSASAEYKSGTATIEISYKGKPSELWQDVSKDAKKSFKLVEMGDDNIILEYRNSKNSSEALNDKPQTQDKQ